MTRLLAIPLVVLVLLAGAMVWSGGGAERAADFTFVNRGEVGSLDPNRMSWMQDIRIGAAIYEGLYALAPDTFEPIPGAAGRVEVSEDKTVWTFHLRPEGRWSNGDPVTTVDFVFAWKRMLEEPGDYTYLFHYIRGAKAYQEAFAEGKRPDFKKVSIEPLDALTLRVTLEHPVTFFPDLCAFAPFFPLNERVMQQFILRDATGEPTRDPKTGRLTYKKDFTRPPHLVTNGPYRLDQWQFKRRLRLVRNEYYWDRANVKSEIIDAVSAEDPSWAFLTYDSGRVHWLAEVTGDIAAELREKGRPDLLTGTSFGTYFYSFNCNPKFADGRDNPLHDVRVRRALSMAVDKRPIVEQITRMGEQPARTYIPLGVFPEYESPAGLPYDIDAARKLLADAGYPGGRGFPRLTILFNNEFHHGPVAQIVRRQWEQGLGVRFELEPVEIKTFRQRLHNKEYDVARASWYGDYNDLSTFTDKYLSESENNDAAWKNKEFDDLCREARPEPDEAKRRKLFAQAEQILLDEAPIMPLYYYVNTYLLSPDTRGIRMNPRNLIVFKSVEVVR